VGKVFIAFFICSNDRPDFEMPVKTAAVDIFFMKLRLLFIDGKSLLIKENRYCQNYSFDIVFSSRKLTSISSILA